MARDAISDQPKRKGGKMNKYEFVTELMELFDAIDTLKRDNEDLRHALNRQFNMFDYYALKKGREAILEECIYSWKECRACRNDAGEIVTTDFNDWVREKVHRVPDYMSKKALAEYFAVELKDMYEEEKAKAISRLEASEAEEGGE